MASHLSLPPSRWRHFTYAFALTAASCTYGLDAARALPTFRCQAGLYASGLCLGAFWLSLLLLRSPAYIKHQRHFFRACLALTSAYSASFFWMPLQAQPAPGAFYLQRMWMFPVLTTLAGRAVEETLPMVLLLVVPVHLSLDTAWQYRLCQAPGTSTWSPAPAGPAASCSSPPRLLSLLLFRMLPSVLGLLGAMLLVSLFAQDDREAVVAQGAGAQEEEQEPDALGFGSYGSSAAAEAGRWAGLQRRLQGWARAPLRAVRRCSRLVMSELQHKVSEDLAKKICWPLAAVLICVQVIRISLSSTSSPVEVLVGVALGMAVGRLEGKDISQVWFDQLTAMTALAHDLVPSHVAQHLVQQIVASWPPQEQQQLCSQVGYCSAASARSLSCSSSVSHLHSALQADASCSPSRPHSSSSCGGVPYPLPSPPSSHWLLHNSSRPELREDAPEAGCGPEDAASLAPAPRPVSHETECEQEISLRLGSRPFNSCQEALLVIGEQDPDAGADWEDELASLSTWPAAIHTLHEDCCTPGLMTHAASQPDLPTAAAAGTGREPEQLKPLRSFHDRRSCPQPPCGRSQDEQRLGDGAARGRAGRGSASAQLPERADAAAAVARPQARGSADLLPLPWRGWAYFGSERSASSARSAGSSTSGASTNLLASWSPAAPRQQGRGGAGAGQAPGSDPSSPAQKLLAFSHAAVTVLFADIVGFTALSKGLEPYQVFEFLNELYARYDAMVDSFRVYKVETIGDCYMCATGLLHEDPAHAAQMVLFAQEMQRQAAQVQMPDGSGPVRVRVGIHSGPLLSGVIGRIRKRYCVVGSTVNLASRMESTGVPGRVHVSGDTHALVRDLPGFEWECRGDIEVKGVGPMVTYMLRQPETLGQPEI